MKKVILLTSMLFGILSMVSAGLNFPNPAAYIDFSNGTSSNASIVDISNPSDEPYTESATMKGVTCRKIPSGKFMYVKFDDSAVPSSQNKIMIKVTYYGNNNNALWFNYNGTSNDYAGADITKVKSDGWVTTIITLTDASFSNKMRDGSDIRLGYNGSDNYIKEISLAFGELNPDGEPVPEQKNTTFNQFKGRSFGGYQVWHEAGNNDSDWVHWSYGHKPGPGFHLYNGVDVSSYPDVSEYEDSHLYATNFGNLGNGKPAKLYHSKEAYIINKQMDWMKTAGFDGVAIQRFVGGIGKSVTESDESHLTNVKNACEATGRLFYICYDLNGSDATIVQRIKMDWVYEIEQIRALTSSPNYATVAGKPVVELWGIGYDMASPEQDNGIIDFLHSRGCYVIGGTPNGWANGGSYANTYKKLDCVSPWTVGVYGDINGAKNYKNTMINDKNYCDQNGMDYLPVVFAGSANWLNDALQLSQTFRKGGELLWTQITNAKELGLNAVYFAMVDEFEESTNLIKGAVDYFDIPVDQYFETFSRDGIWVSSDFYLRLASYAAQVLRGEKSYTEAIPVPYSEGPIYFRNSFESKLTSINKNGSGKGEGQQPDYTMTLPVDPCFYNASQVQSENVNATCAIVKDEQKKNGNYSVKLSGSGNANAKFAYKTNETKIVVKDYMTLTYQKYAQNANGQYAFVDLLFSDNTRLSDAANSPIVIKTNTTGSFEKVEVNLGTAFTGKTITGILMAYKNASSGDFTAYFDDVIIENGENTPVVTGSPDLVITDFFWIPANPVNGGNVLFYATVKNQGTAATPDNVKHGISFHITGVEGATWCDTHYASLGVGESVTLTANGGNISGNSAYWVCGANQTYEVMAWVNDNGGTFEESNMNNNQVTKTLSANGATELDGALEAEKKVVVENGLLKVEGYSSDAKIAVYSYAGSLLQQVDEVADFAEWTAGNGIFVVNVTDRNNSDSYKIVVE